MNDTEKELREMGHDVDHCKFCDDALGKSFYQKNYNDSPIPGRLEEHLGWIKKGLQPL